MSGDEIGHRFEDIPGHELLAEDGCKPFMSLAGSEIRKFYRHRGSDGDDWLIAETANGQAYHIRRFKEAELRAARN